MILINYLVVFTIAVFTMVALVYVHRTRYRYTTIDAFLTARGTLGVWASAATVFASIMGGWILFTPAEAGTWGGVTAFTGYAVAQALAIAIYAILGSRMRLVAPRGSSLVEFVYYRYGRLMYAVILVVGVFYMAVFLCAELTGIALGVNMVTGLPLWFTALLIGAGTMLYTTYGGIRGSIFTDAIQAVIIIPALLLAFVGAVVASGGVGALFSAVGEIDPSLLSMGHWGGWEFALSLLIAVVAANLFHQGFWSRVYACRDSFTVKSSFLLAGIMIVPVVILAGSFGLIAVSKGLLDVPSAALFEVVLSITPLWVLLVVLVLALALVMSSTDTLLNGIAAVFTVDLARFYPSLPQERLRIWARIFTAAVCVIVVAVASRGYSVLYLFFLADLVCAAAVFPTFYGLYSSRLGGKEAVVAVLIGIAAGAFFFPDPAFSRGNLLHAFVVALVVPAVISFILSILSSTAAVDLEDLQEKVQDIKT